MLFTLRSILFCLIPSSLLITLLIDTKEVSRVSELVMCSDDYPDGHAFLIMGSDEVFLDHLPRIYHENHHYQLVCKANFPNDVKQIYLEDSYQDQDSFYMLVNREKFILPDIPNSIVTSFPALILKMSYNNKGRPITGEFIVNIERVIRFRPFPKNAELVDTLEYFMFGNDKEVFLSNNITVQPDFYVTSKLVNVPSLTNFDPALGTDVILLNYFRESPCQKPSETELRLLSKANREETTVHIKKHLLFTTAEVNMKDPCKED